MYLTLKLYEQNSHLTNCTADILACTYDDKKKKYAVILDRTVFFPEGGGQFADLGTLTIQTAGSEQTDSGRTIQVLDVQISDDQILHYTEQPIPEHSTVFCEIDHNRRFDFMQQHSAEHILSGLVHRTYGYNNVGFHLGLTETTLDFDGPLTPEQISDLEVRANHAVWENIPFEITFPEPDVLSTLDYRSKKELTGAVRIVTLPGYDVCACCAPHVSLAGEIGLIKIVGYMAHRGGVRLTILCGNRALADYRQKQSHAEQISSLLSVKQPEISAGVKKTLQDKQDLVYRINDLQKRLLEAELKSLPSPSVSSNALLFQKDLDTKAIRNAVNDLCTKYDGYCGIFAGDAANRYNFVLGSNTKNCQEAAIALRETFGAKSGGSPRMIQGSVCATEEAIRTLFS